MYQLNETVFTIMDAPRSLTRSGRLAIPTNVLTLLEMEVNGDGCAATHPISTQAPRIDASTSMALFAFVMIYAADSQGRRLEKGRRTDHDVTIPARYGAWKKARRATGVVVHVGGGLVPLHNDSNLASSAVHSQMQRSPTVGYARP